MTRGSRIGERSRAAVGATQEGGGVETLDPETDVEGLGAEPELEEGIATDRPWLVIVWNDPVNLMSYVVFVFQKLFGYSREKATKLMLEVHHDGKSAVSSGTREKAENDVSRLHAHGLWATMERDTP